MDIRAEFDALIEAMSLDDMPSGDMKFVAEQCGVRIAISLLKNISGNWIYIPKRDAFKKIVDKIVIDKFNGSNAKNLAVACRISERHVYDIIEKEDARRKGIRPKIKQLNLFDDEKKTEPVEVICNG
jgi:hypothetical protein